MSASRLLLERYFDPQRTCPRVRISLEASVARSAFVLLVPGDQLSVGLGPKRLGRRQDKDRLEHVRLAGPVWSVQDGDAGCETEVEGLVGPEMA